MTLQESFVILEMQRWVITLVTLKTRKENGSSLMIHWSTPLIQPTSKLNVMEDLSLMMMIMIGTKEKILKVHIFSSIVELLHIVLILKSSLQKKKISC